MRFLAHSLRRYLADSLVACAFLHVTSSEMTGLMIQCHARFHTAVQRCWRVFTAMSHARFHTAVQRCWRVFTAMSHACFYT